MGANNFSGGTKNTAYDRQDGCCAGCGTSFWEGDDPQKPFAHHVVPQQVSDKPNSFLKSADNCVALCGECHGEDAHGGHHYATFTADPENFPFSHGNDTAAHDAWATTIHDKWGEYRPAATTEPTTQTTAPAASETAAESDAASPLISALGPPSSQGSQNAATAADQGGFLSSVSGDTSAATSGSASASTSGDTSGSTSG